MLAHINGLSYICWLPRSVCSIEWRAFYLGFKHCVSVTVSAATRFSPNRARSLPSHHQHRFNARRISYAAFINSIPFAFGAHRGFYRSHMVHKFSRIHGMPVSHGCRTCARYARGGLFLARLPSRLTAMRMYVPLNHHCLWIFLVLRDALWFNRAATACSPGCAPGFLDVFLRRCTLSLLGFPGSFCTVLACRLSVLLRHLSCVFSVRSFRLRAFVAGVSFHCRGFLSLR